ncbi:MAG: translocation/assembly module TamB domain-containing protein [Desulfobacterales bacterium]|nr:translocation/assembly module TamB domain-containing protein [Desulfobacterales bacterium]
MKRTPPEEASAPGGSGRRRLLKRLLKVLSATLLVLVALGVLGTLVLQVPAVQKRAKALAVDTLERQTGLRLELGSLSGSLFTNLSATDLRLDGPSGPLLAAERISIGYALPLLLKHMLVIRYLRFDGLQVYLVRKADGTWNVEEETRRFASPAGEAPSGPPLAVVVKRLAIDGGTLSIRDETSAPPRIRQIENLRLDLQLDIGPEIKADLRQLAFSLDDPRIVVTGLEGRLRYDQRQAALHVEGLNLKTEASAVSVDAGITFQQPDPEITAAARIDTLSLAELGRVLEADDLKRGDITGRIDLQGTPRQLHHRLRLVLDRHQSLAAEGELVLTGEGALALETTGSLTDIDPAAWPFIDAPHLNGDVDADFSISAHHLDGPQRQVHLKLQVAASRMAGFAVETGDFDVTLENGDLAVTTAALTGSAGRIRLQGRVAGIETGTPFANLSISGEVRDLDPAAFLTDPLWAGKVNADFEAAARPKLADAAAGDLSDWTAEADLTLRPSVLFGTPVARARAKANWDGALVRLTSFELDSDLGQAALNGQAVARDRSYRVAGRIDFPALPRLKPLLARLVPDFPSERVPAGTLQITGQVDGSPRKTAVNARVTGGDLVLDPVGVAALELDGTFQITGAVLSGQATGRFSDIDYQGRRFPRLELSADLKPEQLGVDLSLAHAAGEQLTLKGTVDQWQRAERRVRIETLRVTGVAAPLDRLMAEIRNTEPIRLRTDPNGVDVDSLKLTAGKASLQAGGRLALDGPQQFQLSIARLSLEGLESLWQDQPTLKGNLSAEVKLNGTAAAPVIDATLAARDVSGYDVSLAKLDLRLGYRDDTASLTATGSKENLQLFELTARSGLVLRLQPFEFVPKPGSLQARLEANDLKLSELPLPAQREVKLDGRVTVKIQAAGDLRQPQLTGSLILRDGSLALPRHGLTYESLQADLRLLPGKLTIEHLLANGDQEGNLSLTGQVLLDGVTPREVNLHLTGKRAAFAWNREFTARIEPDISLTGPLASPLVSGLISIPEGRINLDRLAAGRPADIVVLGDQSAEGQPIVIGETRESPLSPLAADVRIEIPRNVWLRGQGVNAEIAGAIRLKKEKGAPFLLTGALNTVRGTYEFQGRRFNITRGVVEFQGLPEPDPGLDIQAEARISSVTIIVRITGSVRDIQLSLDSDPAMDQSDIVSYLVFGRPTNELRSQQATSAEAAALSLAGNLAAKELNTILGDTFKVDIFSINPGEDGWSSSSLTVGKYVTRNIFVTYNYEFSAQSFGEVGIEYQINRNFSIAAQVGNERTSGVDLIWKLDF